MANVLNYTEQGGSRTVIGGELVVTGKLTLAEGAEVEGFPVAENQEDSTATSIADLKKDLNDLLSKLKAAGLMAGD
jgi:hypothetical protein